MSETIANTILQQYIEGSLADFFERCRFCFTNFPVIEIDKILMEQIEYLAGINFLISSEKLSKKLCINCQSRLDDSYRFKLQITENQEKLAELIKNEEKNLQPKFQTCSVEVIQLIKDIEIESKFKKISSYSKYPNSRCPICDKKFKERREIPFHIERVHAQRKDHQCDLCNYRCFKKFDISLHHRNVHLKDSSIDSKVLCPQCGKTMRNNSDLRRHQQKQHLLIKRFFCEFCEFASFERSAMKLHLKTHLPMNCRDFFECDKCGKNLSTQNTLKAHINNVHNNIRSYACPICSKSFTQKSCLIKHQKSVHERHKEYQCDICSIFVSQACYLKKHKLMMHPPDGKKVRYPCEVCAQDFSTEQALKNHQKIHSEPELECNVCFKKFYQKGNLLDHQEHHMTLPHPCQHCRRSFRNESKLSNHLKRVHFKKKTTYSCELCSSAFTRRTTYRDHVLKQHKDLKAIFCNELLERISKMSPDENR